MRDAIEGILREIGKLFGGWAESLAEPEDDYYRLRFPNGDVFKFRTWFLSFLPSGVTFRYLDGKLYFVLFSVDVVEFIENRKKVVEVIGWGTKIDVNTEDEKDVEEVSERIVYPVLGTLSLNASLVYHLPLIVCPARDVLLEVIRSLADAYCRFPQYENLEKAFNEAGVRPFVNEIVFYRSNPYWEWGGEYMEFTEEWKENTTRLVRGLIEGEVKGLVGFDGYEVRSLGLREVEAPDRIKLKSRLFEDMARFINEKNEQFLSYVEEKKKAFLFPNGSSFLLLGAENIEEVILAVFNVHRLAEKFLFPLSRWERVLTS